MKSDDFTDDSKVAIELTDLATQLSEAIGQRDRIVRIIGVKKAIDRRLDERGFRRSAALGSVCQSRSGTFGEIDANSRFHRRHPLKTRSIVDWPIVWFGIRSSFRAGIQADRYSLTRSTGAVCGRLAW